MSPFWKIFIAIFCYIAGIVGLGLAVLNASEKPPRRPSRWFTASSGWCSSPAASS